MTLHLVKLCVGCDSVEDLAGWQKMCELGHSLLRGVAEEARAGRRQDHRKNVDRLYNYLLIR